MSPVKGMGMQNILIGDRHYLYGEAMAHYIEAVMSGTSVSVANGDTDFMNKLVKEKGFDLLILDSGLLGRSENMRLGAVRKSHPEVPLVLTFGQDEKIMSGESVSEFGVSGIVSKALSCRAMVQVLEKVLTGTLSAESAVLPGYHDMQKARPENPFTPREREVLHYLVQGDSNKEIARALDLQVVTVKLHVRGICRKSGARNRTEAALIARENGWA